VAFGHSRQRRELYLLSRCDLADGLIMQGAFIHLCPQLADGLGQMLIEVSA